MEIKLVIDGVEVNLEPNGKSKTYEKFKEPDGLGEEKPLIASVYVKTGWKPKKG